MAEEGLAWLVIPQPPLHCRTCQVVASGVVSVGGDGGGGRHGRVGGAATAAASAVSLVAAVGVVGDDSCFSLSSVATVTGY